MALIPLSIIFATFAVAFSMMIRRLTSLGILRGSRVDRKDIARTRTFAEQSPIASPLGQFLVVVLPDGKVVYQAGGIAPAKANLL
jgi:hypothetical protein